MTTVLVTGSPARTEAVTAALEAAGVRCLTRPGEERIDAYVQLPVDISSDATTAIGRVRDFLSAGLVHRFAEAEAVLPTLADGAAVYLVAGNAPSDRGLADDQHARSSLLRVLGHAVLADRPGGGVRAVVLPSTTSPQDVANHVLGRPTEHDQAVAHFVDEEPGESYADWRVDLLSLATRES